MRGIVTHPKPTCPKCGRQMRLRRPKPHQSWKAFWGCAGYPDDCDGVVEIDGEGNPDMETPPDFGSANVGSC